MGIGGHTLNEAEGFLIAAFPRRGGHAPELDNFDHLLGLGRTLGRMHGVGQATAFKTRINYSLEGWLIDPLDFLGRHWVPSDLYAAWDSLGRDLIDRATRLMVDYSPDEAFDFMVTVTWAIFYGAMTPALCRPRRLRHGACDSGFVDVPIR